MEERRNSSSVVTRPSYGAYENGAMRLVVSEADEEISDLCVDADIAPRWSSVCGVIIESRKVEACPVCLDQVVAPVTTKCGHIFCAECIVHHALMFEVTRSRKCPCCLSVLEKEDLRPLYLDPKEEDDVFLLMERDRSQRTAWSHGSGRKGLPHFGERDAFSKVYLCNPDQASQCLAPFFAAVRNDAAYAVLDAVRAAYVARVSALVVSHKKNVKPKPKSDHSTLGREDESIHKKRNQFVFYGAASGSTRYLHPLLLRSLLAFVGNDAKQLPASIRFSNPSAKHKAKERFEVCPAARKRMPWIAHLQLNSEIELCFADLEKGQLRVKFDNDWDRGHFGKQAFDARPPELIEAFRARNERLRREIQLKRKSEKKTRSNQKQKHHTQNNSKYYDSRLLEATFEERRRTRQQFELNDHDFAPLVDGALDLNEDLDDDIGIEQSRIADDEEAEKPSFADLVSRGFAAELGFPALGSSPTAMIGFPALGSSPTTTTTTILASSPASKSPWGASSSLASSPLEHKRPAPAWGQPRQSNTLSKSPHTSTTPMTWASSPTRTQPPPSAAAAAAALLPGTNNDRIREVDEDFAPPPQATLALAGLLDNALKAGEATSTSSKKKKKKKGGIALSLTGGGGRGTLH